ncbi:maleylpyruvate isomerase family mycothiol-dependent enzyme [Actinoplanes sp. NPDC020271]|uniref:maleylpyruvate isomerase family mycothiol-dependent enzyme n=1 Tax=Actinoplanes sp. NPDC020271 TaxID=3363896 RepID=UPI0037B57C22
MTSLAGRTIAALRSEHDALAAAVPALTTDQLTGPSGATEWTVADVLSHLGSGAEINLATIRAALGEAEKPGPGFNQGIWDRWNALGPQDQAAGWLASDEALVAALEAIPAERHDELRVDMGFLPEPLPLAGYTAMRLSEVALHSWDVRAGVDPAAPLAEPSAQLLAEHLSAGISFLLGFIGKPAAERGEAVVGIDKTAYRIVLADNARLTTEDLPVTATFDGPLEAAIRLIYGRLGAAHTPAGVDVTGNITLDELRATFPGF